MHVRGRPMAFTFSVETVVRRCHTYKEIWNIAMDGTALPCERETGNTHDHFVVAIKKVTPTGNVAKIDIMPQNMARLTHAYTIFSL